jgi:hypothetical protein
MSKAAELAALIGSGQAQGDKNLIINGAMQVSQRGTSAVAVPNGGYSTVDRMRFYESTGGAYTSEQSSDVPAGQGFSKSIKLACTTADSSIGAAEIANMSQVIEGQNLQRLNYGTSDAKTITLSFWVKSNKTGIYTIAMYKHAGGGTAYGCPVEYTISSANTWEKKTITVTPTAGSTTLITSSAGAIIDSNGAGIEVHWGLAWGSNYNSTNNTWSASGFYSTSNQVNWLDSTSNNFYITGIQLEISEVATPFEHESFAATLQKCQRYYFDTASAVNGKSGTGINGGFIFKAFNGNEAAGYNTFPVTMRTVPTITCNDNAGTQGKLHRYAHSDVGSNIAFANMSASGVTACSQSGTFSDSSGGLNIYGGRIRASAEL